MDDGMANEPTPPLREGQEKRKAINICGLGITTRNYPLELNQSKRMLIYMYEYAQQVVRSFVSFPTMNNTVPWPLPTGRASGKG